MPPLPLQTLRSLRWLARLVLAWFVLSIGVAVASPLVQPKPVELICLGSGAVKLVVKTDDGAQDMPSHTLDCPLCATPAAPPPTLARQVPPPHPLAHVLRAIPAARMAALTRSPLPARGPPASV